MNLISLSIGGEILLSVRSVTSSSTVATIIFITYSCSTYPQSLSNALLEDFLLSGETFLPVPNVTHYEEPAIIIINTK